MWFSSRRAKNKVKKAIESEFHLKPDAIHLTSPTFFSEMTDEPAKTVHDEYWHPHVDKVWYFVINWKCDEFNFLYFIWRKHMRHSILLRYCTWVTLAQNSKEVDSYSRTAIGLIVPLNLAEVNKLVLIIYFRFSLDKIFEVVKIIVLLTPKNG